MCKKYGVRETEKGRNKRGNSEERRGKKREAVSERQREVSTEQLRPGHCIAPIREMSMSKPVPSLLGSTAAASQRGRDDKHQH